MQRSSFIRSLSARCFSTVPHSHSPLRIVHVTDSEGSSFLTKSLALNPNSPVIYHPDRGLQFHYPHSNLRSHPRGATPASDSIHFIYGGDATDRGPHDLETLELLLDFKKRHPANVHLLVGNRDIKSSRLAIELNPHGIRERIKKTTAPFWLPQLKTLPIDIVKEKMKKEAPSASHSAESLNHYIHSLSIEQCQILYLQWALQYTMGSPNTWNYRQEEITTRHSHSNFHKKPLEHVVLESFIHSTHPLQGAGGRGGLQAEYLKAGKIAVEIPHSGVLAVHGAITDDNIGLLPSTSDSSDIDISNRDSPIQDLRDWIKKFNFWFDREVQQWIKRVEKHHSHPVWSDIGADPLNRAALPVANRPKFPITADYLTDKRGFQPISSTVAQYLQSQQISLLLTGHQPIGDFPAVLRSDALRSASNPQANPGVFFLNGDTSYGGFGRSDFSPLNPRGPVCHLTEIEVTKPGTLDIRVSGVISNGETVHQTWRMENGNIVGDPFIGRVMKGHELVQCRLENGKYRVAHQKGHEIEYREADESEIREKCMQP